jgi:hypothetical protein
MSNNAHAALLVLEVECKTNDVCISQEVLLDAWMCGEIVQPRVLIKGLSLHDAVWNALNKPTSFIC